jgi:hypothetical protein
MKNIHKNGYDLFVRWSYLFFQTVEWKYFSFNGLEILQIQTDEFLSSKFGAEYLKILPYLEEGYNEKVLLLEWGVILTCGYRDFYFQWFSRDWALIKKKENIWFNSIYAIAIDKDNRIFYTIPTASYVWIFSLEEDKEILPYSDYKFLGIFDYPEDIKIYWNEAYISNMGNNKLMTMNIVNLEVTEYLSFFEPVWEYIRLNELEIVRLDSWIYVL